MSRLVDWFRDRLRVGSQETRPRLDQSRVLEIARAAAASYPEAAQLSMTIIDIRAGAKIWSVSTPTMGQMLVVEIDDATEAVLSVERVGLR